MKIKITADSTCDLSETLLRQWNISLIPMHILMGEESLLDGVTVRPADVFTHVQNGGKTFPAVALAPLAQLSGYATALRSLSQGLAGYIAGFDHLAELAGKHADEVVKARAAEAH